MLHFRFRGNDIEVCRLAGSSGGDEQRLVLGIIQWPGGNLPDALRSSCTPDELAEIERRLRVHKKAQTLQAELTARTLPDQIQRAHLWLSELESQDLLQDLAEDIRANWQQLRRTLERRKLI